MRGLLIVIVITVCAAVAPLPAVAEKPTWKPLDRSTGCLPGEAYAATVPDTLDLAERARLAVNGLTGLIDPDADGEMFLWVFFNTNPPTMTRWFDASTLQAKCVESDPMMRVMCGSDQNMGLREMSISWLLKLQDPDDGLFYSRDVPERPWHRTDSDFVGRLRGPGSQSMGSVLPGSDQDYARIYAQIRILRALNILVQFEKDSSSLKEIGRRLVAGIDKMAIHKTDTKTGERYAYFPAEGGISNAPYLAAAYPKSGWKSDREPANERDGPEEGSVFMGWGAAPGALTVWYELTGQKEALELAGEFVRFLTRKSMWGSAKDPFTTVIDSSNPSEQFYWERPPADRPERSAQLAHWEGHWEGHMEALRSILEYAIATNDVSLKHFAQSGYEWARHYGLPQIGFADMQSCYIPRVMALAVKLTEAGVGDYWEDIDRYIRNNGTAQQICDPEMLAAIVKDKPKPVLRGSIDSADRVLEKSIGLFCAHANETEAMIAPAHFTTGCCFSHACMGLYYAWDAAVRFRDGTATVNLLLNRASPWLDVDSYLPYAGRVVIRNKKARNIYVRIPAWVDKGAVRVRRDKKAARNWWVGNYLAITDAKPGSVITIEFPMAETTEELGGFTMHFKGNTLIDISPRSKTGGYPLYLRDHYKADNAPMKTVTRYIAPFALKW